MKLKLEILRMPVSALWRVVLREGKRIASFEIQLMEQEVSILVKFPFLFDIDS